MASETSLGVCRAAVPVATVSGTGRMLGDSPVFDTVTETRSWRECGEPATAVYEYQCAVDPSHTKQRETCPAHEPVPGDVGCRDCFDAGAERPMTFTRVA